MKDESIFDGVDQMWNFNVQSSVASAHIATNFLKEGGLFILTGADAALRPTPTMIAYGITKAATHHLIASLVDPSGGLPKDAAGKKRQIFIKNAKQFLLSCWYFAHLPRYADES